MQGFFETLVEAIFLRGLSPGLVTLLMAAAPKKIARAQLKKIFVLDEAGDMTGEYILDPDCPIDYNDFLKVLPEEGIGDRESLFVGEYVFTAFQSGRSVFVLLSRGQLTEDDFNWTALLLNAADSQFAKAGRATRPSEAAVSAEREKALAEREARLVARESDLAKAEVKLKADEANVRGRAEELERQKGRLVALADYVSQVQQGATRGMWRATQSLEAAKQIAADVGSARRDEDATALDEARQALETERDALLRAKEDLEGKYREAVRRAEELERVHRHAVEAHDKERAEWAAKEGEADKVRAAIESRVQELSQRFTAMAKDRLMASHKPSAEPPEAVKQAIELEKAQLTKERKFLQRRAIEILDREEQTRDREAKLEEREAALRNREEEFAAREAEFERLKASLSRAAEPAGAPAGTVDEARKDLERRVKIIQQKALELLDREEKLRKRAADLQALEERLVGKVAAK